VGVLCKADFGTKSERPSHHGRYQWVGEPRNGRQGEEAKATAADACKQFMGCDGSYLDLCMHVCTIRSSKAIVVVVLVVESSSSSSSSSSSRYG